MADWFDADTLWLLARMLAGFAGIFVFLRWWEPRMMYYPNHPTRTLEPPPDVPLESRMVTTDDHELIHLWWLKQPEAGAPVVLFCHGNAGNLSHRSQKAMLLLASGMEVVLFDYRGYGQSTGRPDESGTYRDGEAVFALLNGRRVYLYGESLGTGVATELARRHPEVAGLILEAGFTSIPDVAQRLFWFLPVRWLVKNRYENRRKLARIACPVLLLHSRADTVFAFSHAERLRSAAMGPVELVEVYGPHGDPLVQNPRAYTAALQRFLSRGQVQ